MSEPLPSRTKELQAMSRQMLRLSVGLLTGCTNLRAHMFKLELTGRVAGHRVDKEYCVYVVCHCLALECKR